MRRATTFTMIVSGLVLMVIGFAGAAPWGADSVANSDPGFVFAPLVFIVGIMLAFGAAVVYEILPNRRK